MPWDKVIKKWKAGTLRSGNRKTGPKVKSQSQAVAIMLSEKRAAAGGKKEYQASRSKRRDLVSLSSLRRAS